MFFSLFLILSGGLLLGQICSRLHLPALIGMLVWGILLGPCMLNWIDSSILDNSAALRQIALIIILLRAGLNLNLEDLKKVGKPAVLMCFVPATFEMAGVCILGQLLLHLSWQESLLMGSVLAAVSPAVVVPYMIRLMEEGYGTREGIPQLILAGASADDIYVIVLFTCFTSLAAGDGFHSSLLLRIPTSILLGIGAGILCGLFLIWLFSIWKTKTSIQVIVCMALCFALIWLENTFSGSVGFSGLLAIMTCGLTFSMKQKKQAETLSASFSSLWDCAQIFLFVLVGAAVNVPYALQAGLPVVVLIFGALIFRMAGVYVSLGLSHLSKKEKLFCMIAYTPKATVQAAIGAVPLSMSLACGSIILTAAVLAILITAPLGALLIESTYRHLLQPGKSSSS